MHIPLPKKQIHNAHIQRAQRKHPLHSRYVPDLILSFSKEKELNRWWSKLTKVIALAEADNDTDLVITDFYCIFRKQIMHEAWTDQQIDKFVEFLEEVLSTPYMDGYWETEYRHMMEAAHFCASCGYERRRSFDSVLKKYAEVRKADPKKNIEAFAYLFLKERVNSFRIILFDLFKNIDLSPLWISIVISSEWKELHQLIEVSHRASLDEVFPKQVYLMDENGLDKQDRLKPIKILDDEGDFSFQNAFWITYFVTQDMPGRFGASYVLDYITIYDFDEDLPLKSLQKNRQLYNKICAVTALNPEFAIEIYHEYMNAGLHPEYGYNWLEDATAEGIAKVYATWEPLEEEEDIYDDESECDFPF